MESRSISTRSSSKSDSLFRELPGECQNGSTALGIQRQSSSSTVLNQTLTSAASYLGAFKIFGRLYEISEQAAFPSLPHRRFSEALPGCAPLGYLSCWK